MAVSLAIQLPALPLQGQSRCVRLKTFLRSVSSRSHPGKRGDEMLPSQSGNFSQHEFRLRLSAALRRRLHPATALLPKVIASAIGVTAETIINWRNGYSDPSGHKIGLLMDFFDQLGDPLFWSDVYGPIGDAMRRRFAQRREADQARAAQEEMQLAALTGGGK